MRNRQVWEMLLGTIFLFLIHTQLPAASSDHISLGFDAPTVRAYVVDTENRRSGVNPDAPMSNHGRQFDQGQRKYFHLQEIPGSYVLQDNFDGVDHTAWEITLRKFDNPYRLNYTTTAAAEVIGHINIDSQVDRTILVEDIEVFLQPGIVKILTFEVSVTGQIQVKPLVSPGDLIRDTQTAFLLKKMGPEQICHALERLAKTAERERKDKNKREALEQYRHLLERLHTWGQKGPRSDWEDFRHRSECNELRRLHGKKVRYFIDEEAYAALKMEAEAWLDSLGSTGDKKDHKH